MVYHINNQLYSWVQAGGYSGVGVFYVGPEELATMRVLHLDKWWQSPTTGACVDVRGIDDGTGSRWWDPDVDLVDADRVWAGDTHGGAADVFAGMDSNDEDNQAILADHQLFLTAAACRIGPPMDDSKRLQNARAAKVRRWKDYVWTTSGDGDIDVQCSAKDDLAACQAQRELLVEMANQEMALFSSLVTKPANPTDTMTRHTLETGRVGHQLAVPNVDGPIQATFQTCPVLVIVVPKFR